jgi:hypothetical protein
MNNDIGVTWTSDPLSGTDPGMPISISELSMHKSIPELATELAHEATHQLFIAEHPDEVNDSMYEEYHAFKAEHQVAEELAAKGWSDYHDNRTFDVNPESATELVGWFNKNIPDYSWGYSYYTGKEIQLFPTWITPMP